MQVMVRKGRSVDTVEVSKMSALLACHRTVCGHSNIALHGEQSC